MSEIVQLYKDEQKTTKVYPKTIASEVYIDENTTIVSQLEQKANKIDVKSSIDNLNNIINIKEDSKNTMKEDYISIIQSKIKNYSYSELTSDIDLLVNKYSSLLYSSIIGKSALQRDIKAIRFGSATAKNKLLVFSGHHAREQHMASIILKQIEFYCENINEKYNNETISDIVKESCIWFIPCINPDGLELCRIGIDSLPSTDTTRINQIKSALEYKIKNSLEIGKDITQQKYDELLQRCGGDLQNYVFDNQDMYMWKANANGVDLHYNCWEDGINGDVVKNWSTSNGKPQSFATQDYIGTIGMGEPENVALKTFINKYSLWTYTLSYHGKGPTTFWNYNLQGTQLRRNYKIITDLSKVSKSPFSETVNGEVGFVGYVYAKTGKNAYTTFSCVRETGWGTEKINEDNNYVDSSSPLTICPLEDYQQPWIWEAEKYIPLHFLQKYSRRQDIVERDVQLSTLDYSSSLNSSKGFIKIPIGNDDVLVKQWGTTVADFVNNQIVMITIPFDYTYKKINFNPNANCFNNIAENKLSINCSKELNQMIIRVYSPVAVTRTFNINWAVEGI